MVESSQATLHEILNALERGLERHRAGDLEAAADAYIHVLGIETGQPDANHYLGVALFQRGDAATAVAHLEAAVAGKPDSAEAFNHLGCALLSLARTEDAERAFQRACSLNHGHAEAHYNLGQVLHALDRVDEARGFLARAVELMPDQAAWRTKFAETLKDLGELAEAARQLEVAIRLRPVSIDALFQRSRVRELAGQGALALLDLKRCAVLDPRGYQALNNLARAHLTRLDAPSAARIMRRAACIAPSDPAIRFNLANCLLAAGDLGQGWREYRWRHLKEEVLVERHGLPPEWDGAPVRGGGLLIYQEQGIGDEIRLASCLADTARAAGAPCIVECDLRLVPLFQRSFPSIRFVEKLPRDGGPPTSVNFADLVRDEGLAAHCALGDLPRQVRPTTGAFPDARSYLLAAPTARRIWKSKLSRLGDGIKLGFLWRTGLASKVYAHYFFDIVDLRPVFALPGVVPVNLQYDDCEDDLRRAERELGILIHRPEGIDLRDDLDDLAALISELDVVVGPMTSVLSLAGAVGTRCIGMNIGLDWTSLGSDRQPWTPSMTVVYKGADRLWREAADDVAALVAEPFRTASAEGSR
jgi:tetratricopeptide (TPR) repeat protein